MGERNKPTVVVVFTLVLFSASSCDVPKQAATETGLAGSHPFQVTDRHYACDQKCDSQTSVLLRAALGLPINADPKRQSITEGVPRAEGLDPHTHLTPISISDALRRVEDQSSALVFLEDDKGHRYGMLGALRLDERLLFQVVHGHSEPKLLTAEDILVSQFRGAFELRAQGTVEPRLRCGPIELETNALYYNFGVTIPTSRLQTSFALRNVGNVPCVLTSTSTSCGCTKTKLTLPAILMPKEELALEVIVEPRLTESLHEWISVSIETIDKNSNGAFTYDLYANQRRPKSITPQTLDFGLLPPDGHAVRELVIVETSTDRFTAVSFELPPIPMTYTCVEGRTPDGFRIFRCVFALKPGEQVTGAQKDVIVLKTDGNHYSQVQIPLKFKTEPRISVTPTAFAFGEVKPGASVEKEVVLKSRSRQAIDIRILSCPANCTLTTSEVDSLVTMRAIFSATEPGVVSSEIRLNAVVGELSELIVIPWSGFVTQ